MNEQPGVSKPRRSCSVVVLFEQGPAREHAVSYCDRLVERFWAQQELLVEWWELAHLHDPSRFHDLLRKAAHADVIVFASNPSADLPDELRAWVERLVALRAEREGALVGLLDPASQSSDFCPPKFVYLRNAAHRAGMDYWTDIPETLSLSVPDSLESYSERAGRITSVLDEILHHHHPAPSL